MSELKQISAQIPFDLYSKFEQLAKRNERSVSGELRLAMQDRLDKEASRGIHNH